MINNNDVFLNKILTNIPIYIINIYIYSNSTRISFAI